MTRGTVRIPARFRGPKGSANGGYACGLVARALGAGAAEVTLRSPPPLETDLCVTREDDTVSVRDGDTLVAEGRALELELDPPAPVHPGAAAAASRAGYERWAARHPFPFCLVCGPEREPGDGLRLFPGALGDGRFACEWTPAPWTADGAGVVAPELVWAALDCPTSAPVATFGEGPPLMLGRLSASLDAPVLAGEPHAIVAWQLHREGRKRSGGAVLFDADGRPLARSRALWIQLRSG